MRQFKLVAGALFVGWISHYISDMLLIGSHEGPIGPTSLLATFYQSSMDQSVALHNPVQKAYGSADSPAVTCDKTRARETLAAFKKYGSHRQTICPDASWLDTYRKAIGAAESVTVLNIGCNSGTDAIRMARLFSRDPVFNLQNWLNYTTFRCGVCGGCDEEGTRKLYDRNLPKVGRTTVHCVEPLPVNVRALQAAAQHFRLADRGFHVRSNAVTSSSIPPGVKFPDGNIKLGKESVGIDRKVAGATSVVVPTVTVDEYVEREGLGRVDLLLVDTEGNDARVLMGAAQTLAKLKPAYIEFEYHFFGHWKKYELKDTIDYLNTLNYDCYWAGKKRLWQITRCWAPDFEAHKWSNVVCYHRENDVLGGIMRAVAADSLQRFRDNLGKAAKGKKGKPKAADASSGAPAEVPEEASGADNVEEVEEDNVEEVEEEDSPEVLDREEEDEAAEENNEGEAEEEEAVVEVEEE